jgi:hypothetical protein
MPMTLLHSFLDLTEAITHYAFGLKRFQRLKLI